jgi:hypothetical protein
LLAQRFGLYLLLGAWGWGPVEGARLEVHGRHELAGVFLLCYKRVQLRLLWRPPLERIDSQQAADEVDEGDAVIHL